MHTISILYVKKYIYISYEELLYIIAFCSLSHQPKQEFLEGLFFFPLNRVCTFHKTIRKKKHTAQGEEVDLV